MKAATNVAEVRRAMEAERKRVKAAALGALDDVAFQARRDVQIEMRRRFDRPTPFTLNAVAVQTTRRTAEIRATVREAMGVTQSGAAAYVFLRDPGGKAVNPNSVLQAEIEGGRRNDKRMERALQRLGVLNSGWQVVPASGLPPEKLDGYGNVRGSFIVQLISYFQGFGEQGYRANMTDKRKAQLAKRGRTARGFVEVRGVEYFISRGPGTWFGRGSWKRGREQHLAPGIWSRSGLHGTNIKPVFMFVRRPVYRSVLPFEQIVQDTAEREYDALMQWRLADAMARAK
jgi:hypothetical protein